MILGKGKAWGLEQVQAKENPAFGEIMEVTCATIACPPAAFVHPVVDRACPSLLYA